MSNWHDVAPAEALAEGEVMPLRCQGKILALYRVDGQIYATDNKCTHGNAQLCVGFLEGFEIECPLHQGRFDIRTGKALSAPLTEDLVSYPARIDAGRIQVSL